MIYIDLKAAFDSVDRAVLWKSLEGIGTPAVIMDLIRDLHTHTTSRVRVGDEFSPVYQLPLVCARAACLHPTSSAVRSTGLCRE